MSDTYYAAYSPYTYKVISTSNKTIEITKYSGNDGTVNIPQTIDGYTVVSLSSSSFIDNSSIKIINIPATINNISCYFNSPNIEEINVISSNCYYSSEDGVLYDKAKETLIRCPYNYQQETFVVPETVKVIGSHAFDTDASASKTYTSMLNIEINEGVEELQTAAFSDTRFKEIILPDSVKRIGNCAFSGTLASKIHFGSGVEEIGNQMFTTQTGSRTPYLSKITVSPDNKIFSSVDGVLYGNYGRDLVVYPQNKNDVKEYKIPDGVTYIHSCALQACAFNKLDLNNVTEIAENAFMNSTIRSFIVPECLNDFYYEAATSGIEFTVLNPSCNFRVYYFDFGSYNYKYSITVKAYENSTAQAFVNNNSNANVTYTFISLGKYGESSGETEPNTPDEPEDPDEPDNEESEFVYSCIDDNNIKVEAYNGSDTDLLIPSEIDGYTVTEIGRSAFEAKELTSVIIPDTVSSIGRYAFYNCNQLKRVTMPCSTEIMSKAFYGCDSVDKVVLTKGTGQMNNFSIDPFLLDKDNSFMQTPWYRSKGKAEVVLYNGIQNIGNYAFYKCNNVQSVTIPKTVASLGIKSFYFNKSLQNISVSPDNKNYCDVNGVLYSKDKSTLIVYPAGNSEISYDIVDKATDISDYAFSFCQNLKILNFSAALENIGTSGIYDCEALTQVNVPENNEAYCSSDGVLYSKDKSTLVYYPSGKEDKEFSMLPDTTVIGERAVCFTKLELIKISQGVTEIGKYAFYSNRNVSEIVIPNSVKYVNSYAFDLCTSLTKITVCSFDCEFNGKAIPDNVTIYTCTGSTAQAYAEEYGNPVVSIGHKYVDKVLSSSCTEDGYVFKVCTVCGDSYATDEVRTPGHQYTEKVINPTCTQQGYTVFTCSKCGDSYTDSYVKALGHSLVKDKAITATCTTDGLTEGSHCSRCNEVIVAQKAVKAAGHKYSAKVTKATFDKAGSSVISCSVCNIVKSKGAIEKIKSVTLSQTSYTYTGKNLTKPTVTVKDSNGKAINSSNYIVTYISRSTGKSITNLKGIGQYKVKVVFKGNYSGTKYLYFSIKPKSITIKVPSTGSKYVTAKWNKDSSVTGYQVVIATNSSFTKNKKTVTIGKNSTTSYKFTKLKKGTRYYIKICSYKTIKVDGKSAKMYSNYSSVKSIICK